MVSVAASIVVGRLISRGLSPITAVTVAGAASVLGFLSLLLTLTTSSFLAFLPALVLIGFGMSGLVPYGSLILRLAPPEHFGAVTSSRTTIGQIGYSIGLSVSMVTVDALTRGGVIRRLEDAGVPPARTGQSLDAIQAYVRTGTTPSGQDGAPLLQDAAASYHVAFAITMVATAAVVAVLITAYRRWERSLPQQP